MNLLIFNLDNSVINIKGFKDLFLSDNELNLNNNKVLFLTNKKYDKIQPVLAMHPELKYTWLQCCCYKRKSFIKSYIEKHPADNVYCFGGSEKDANIYASLKLKFYIVNFKQGYLLYNYISNSLNNSDKEFWRNDFLYDHKYEPGIKALNIPYSETVVYFKNYLDTRRMDRNTGKITGCNIATDVDGRKPTKIFTQAEFGQTKKNENILGHLEEFASIFENVYIDNQTILVRVPGHDEVVYRDSPMSKLIAKIIDQHKAGVNGSCFLHRSKVAVAAKAESRSIIKHFQTIEVIEEAKKLVEGRTIYLFDDICTSGCSLLACSSILKQAGAREVISFCIAHTCTLGKLAVNSIK